MTPTHKGTGNAFWEIGLNPEQKRAVLATEGPVLILAGAGSGKTKTLTHRIAYLIAEKRVKPEQILAVTFTNKAAGEMRERVNALLERGRDTGQSWYPPRYIGTFHSLCSRFLRQDIAVLGYDRNFNIIDADDQLSLMKKVMKELEMNPDQVRPRSLLEAISGAKSSELSPERVQVGAGSYFEELVGKAYARYQDELRRINALDFDDLIALTVKLFQEHPEVLARYQEQFRYLMVDEYQDTNPLQYRFVTLLAGKYHNLFVIGDDYQSIYSWRQADIRNILSFEEDYPEATVITLDQNYRSTQVILDAASEVIGNNVHQRHKKLWTEKKEGGKIILSPAASEESEAKIVTQEIKKLIGCGRSFSDFAVLYRTNAQSRALEEACLRADIAYKIVGGLKFYQRKEVKDVIAYVRFLQNPRDLLALERILNEPKRGIGEVTLEHWVAATRESGSNFLEAITALRETGVVPERKLKSLDEFAELFYHWRESILHDASLKLALLIDIITRESGYLNTLRDGTSEGEAREENVRELCSVARKFDDFSLEDALRMFLEEVALASDTDGINQESAAVHLMTIHSAKGLEFPVVFIVGLEEGIFPHARSALSPNELEEERRLMYVGLTRAKEQAYLLHAETRTIFGSTQMNPPSRFLAEIPEHLLETRAQQEESAFFQKPKRFTAAYPRQVRTPKLTLEGKAPEPAKDLRPGDMVEHAEFGNGLVIALDGTLVTVAFKKRGVKKMMLGVAPLQKL